MQYYSHYLSTRRVSIDCGGDTPVKQSFKDECDINRIIAKYERGQGLPDISGLQARFADVSSVPSYQEALDMVIAAQDVFDQLPATVRRACGNDPAVFLEAVKDPTFVKEHGLGPTPSPAAVNATTGLADTSKADTIKEPKKEA